MTEAQSGAEHHNLESNGSDPVSQFLSQAERIIKDAQFVIDSLPNVETFSIERSLRLLGAIKDVLKDLNDPWLDDEDIENMMSSVTAVEIPLHNYQDAPPPPWNIGTSRVQTGLVGCPSYSLDLTCACELHEMGNTWESVADSLGVARRTLYYHLQHAGLLTARREYTRISDEDLDEVIAGLSLRHPLAGTSIMGGHLSALDIHVSPSRIQESLQ